MARIIDTSKPLSVEDVNWLRARRPIEYVDRMIELAGGIEAEGAENRPEKDEEGIDPTETHESAEDAGDGLEDAREGIEDLIGEDSESEIEFFDVVGSTEAEVKSWAATASGEAKAIALAHEQSREDREPRKGVMSVLA